MKTLTASGVNLFRLAAQQMGDVGEWVRIAEVNRLFDPNITAARTVKIPPTDQTPANGLPE